MKTNTFCGLSPENLARFKSILNRTYGSISCDCEGCSHSEVVDMSLDADRMLVYGAGHKKAPDHEQFYREVIKPTIRQFYGTPEFKRMLKVICPR
jgi:hypothetical protein